MSEKFTFLFTPLDGFGHVNPAIGIAQQLLAKGHKVVFGIPICWKGKLEPLGIVEHYIEGSDEIVSKEAWLERFKYLAPVLAMTPIKRLEYMDVPFFHVLVQDTKRRDAEFRRILAEVQPDVVVVDLMIHNPGLVDQGKLLVASKYKLPKSDKNST